MTLFYPCHKNENENKKNPHQNLSVGDVIEGWNLRRRLHMGFLAEFRGFGVRMTRVRRRTRTKRRTPPKYTIMELTKNLIVAHRRCLPIVFLEHQFYLAPNFFWPKFFSNPNYFWIQNFFRSKIFLDPTFFWTHNFFWTNIFFTPNIFFGPQIFLTQNELQWKHSLEEEKGFYFNWCLTLKTKSYFT